MKRHLGIILSLLMVITFVTGCSTSTSTKGSSDGEKISIKVGHAAAETNTIHWGWLEFKNRVEEKSKGRITVDVYPNSQLGNERELIEATQLGNVTMSSTSTAPVAAFKSEFFAFDLPFVYNDRETIYGILDGEIGQSIMDKLKEVNIVGLGFWENGFRHITTSTRAVRSIEDMSGLKFRTMENEIHMEAFRLLGASPVPMAWGEVYTALQQKTVDGQETPLELIYNTKLHEVQNYITKTGHLYAPTAVLMNKEFFDGLSAEDQKIISDSIKEVTPLARERAAQKEKEAETEMAKTVEIIALSDEEHAKFREKMEPAFEIVRKKVGADLVDKILEATK